jgi:cbb3-type cytochrome oxidase maturation protein
MSVVILLILASLAVGLVFVGAFVWSVRSGQYEDTLTPSLRVLLDDPTPRIHSQPAGRTAAPGPVAEKKPPRGQCNSTNHESQDQPII